jgi:hypothetical protein
MPLPKRRKGESVEKWRSRIIRQEIRSGRDPKQAAAIAYQRTGTGRVSKRTKRRSSRRSRRK